MEKSDWTTPALVICIGFAIFLTIVAAAARSAGDAVREEAVLYGHAEKVGDHFKWKPKGD